MAHANRATMKGIKGDINKLRTTVDDHEKRLKGLEEREIVTMLQETNMPGSSKPRYTYKEIADSIGVSPSKVNNIASKNNLSRRNIG